MNHEAALIATLVAVAGVVVGPAAAVDARTNGQAGPEATTLRAEPLNSTTVMLWGNVTGVNGSATVWFEYRRVDADEWRRTPTRRIDGPGPFVLNATGLAAATEYEFRTVAATSAGRVDGSIRPFKTPPNGSAAGVEPTTVPGPTPVPPALTVTPTPEGEPEVDAPADPPPDDQLVAPDAGGSGDDWFAGWTRLLLLVAGVPVAGAFVLGGLVLALGLYDRGREE